jgi:hypothetical protein
MNRDEQASPVVELAQEEPVFSIEEMESRLEMQIIEVPCDMMIDGPATCCCIIV